MHPQRQRIETYVAEHPGAHFSELSRELDLATGQVQYHVRKLVRGDALARKRLYGRTHFYPPSYDEWQRSALALLCRETAREILFVLLEEGPAHPDDVADDVGIARATVEYHVDRLREQDLIDKEYGEGNRVTLSVSDPEATADLLAAIEPSLPDRLIDRFVVLVDDLFAD
ncbi:winged helix-turn-helix transcriptional regulator [Halobellus marinus]|uniref:winged helix-turn-helix transcriptional regulator n=1 Tax=Halobellus TaxID=1073986 RepID=UPI0028AA6BD4|nr:winged helix-turn-helix transcriptional regulator [Halobellus sp. DFY28]